MDLRNILFVALAAITLIPAFVVAFSRNLVYSAFALFFSLAGIAGLYGFLAADFLAIVQLLIYVGGIMVLILFGVVFTQKIHKTSVASNFRSLLPAILVGALLFCLLFVTLAMGIAWQTAEDRAAEPTIDGIGNLLLSKHLLPFEIASVLLLIVLIGAVAIARKELE